MTDFDALALGPADEEYDFFSNQPALRVAKPIGHFANKPVDELGIGDARLFLQFAKRSGAVIFCFFHMPLREVPVTAIVKEKENTSGG